MSTRKTRGKRIKYDEASISSSTFNDQDDRDEEARKSRIRDSNKEYAKRMTILQSWTNYWEDYTTRQGDAYPPLEAKEIIKKTKKITCPIESCGKAFTSYGGLKYHYARCNIERCYKCKLCDPNTELSTKGELLKHMILKHYYDAQLPALEGEQKEIANLLLSGETRIDKNKARVCTETEPASTPSRLINAFCELQNRVYKSRLFEERSFKHWRSCNSDWEYITHEFDRSRFYPPEYESVRFRLKQNNNCDNWRSIKTGESIPMKLGKDGQPISTVFYTGGVNTAAAWLPKAPNDKSNEEILAIAIDCCSMDHNRPYKLCNRGEACIQFWVMDTDSKSGLLKLTMSYIVAHQYGTIFDMMWCPLGTSWEQRIVQSDNSNSTVTGRVGLLALACGDGQIRIISVPHTEDLSCKTNSRISETTIEATPIYRVRPVATLVHPGAGASTDFQSTACRQMSWSLEANQRYIAAGYTNGTIALFDLQNTSPIIYSNLGDCHIHQPLKSCIAHGAPITGICISTGDRDEEQSNLDRVYIASGSTDRVLKIWNVAYDHFLNNERAPITKILWDYRFRGIITATDAAFTSYNNRVSYRYPLAEGHQNVTISTHRSIVWSLGNSLITNAIATSDGAGEVFMMPQTFNRMSHKRDRSLLNIYSLYSLVPQALESKIDEGNDNNNSVMRFTAQLTSATSGATPTAGDFNNELDESIMLNYQNENFEIGIGSGMEEDNDIEVNADFSALERPVANKPERFLIPLEQPPIDTYSRFKTKFGLEFIDYNQNVSKRSNLKIPESCARAGNIKNIFCDRSCDYPFSSINNVVWSPNLKTFPYLLSTTHVGLCRLDRVQAVEHIYKHLVDEQLSK